MSANVGLSTPRGSGTSGYVQRNLSVLKPRDAGYGAPYPPKDHLPPRQRKPDKEILEHDRKREIEVKVLEFRDKLEDEGKMDEDEMDKECDVLRKKLLGELERKSGAGGDGKGLKMHQVHELAEAKIRESERLRRALGLKGDEADEGGEHPMARQERRKREMNVLRENEETMRRNAEKNVDSRDEDRDRERERHKERNRNMGEERR